MKTLFSALLVASSIANAVQTGKQVETLLKSPGARELMAEEVQSWQSSVETKHLSIQNQVAVAGSVILRGTPSPAQRFNRGKLVRCNVRLIGSGQFAAIRNSCDLGNPVYLPLSLPGRDTPTAVSPGFYVLGFENSVNQGFVEVKAGQTVAINLEQIAIPSGGNVKVFRDLNAVSEEVKLYFTTYVLGAPMFSLAEYSFGDLYIKTFGMPDGAAVLNYKICEASSRPNMTDKGTRLCKAYNMGSFMMLSEMFDFAANGSFSQWAVGAQGMAYKYPTNRYLVAKRTNSSIASFVNVLPGQYAVEVTDAKGTVTRKSVASSVIASPLSMNIGWIPVASQMKMTGITGITVPLAIDPTADPNAPSAATLAAEAGDSDVYIDQSTTCSSASMWRTDLRAYCRNDATPGCARSAAKVCEPMFDMH